MEKWRDSTWGEEISLEYGKANRGCQNAVAPFRVYGTNGPIGWTEERLAPGPGVVLGRKGAYRGVHFSREPFSVIDTAYWVKPKSDDLDMRWLYYAIVYHKLGKIDDGSPIPSTPRAAVYVRNVRVPPKYYQKQISLILGSFDDKIELNRRMNEVLEKMVRVLFKDWFVDFGPTRAKVAFRDKGPQTTGIGYDPYLAPDLWALFPDRFNEESGLPDGWSIGTLGDVAVQCGESVRPEALDPATPYIGLKHMPRRSITLSEWSVVDKVSSAKRSFRCGDLLFGKLAPHFHKVGFAPVDGVCSTDIVVLNAREQHSTSFVLACISQNEFVAFADRTSSGTIMPRTKWSQMARFELCVPCKRALRAFDELVKPILDRITLNVHESRSLGATRDLLLPKLMSGELRVKDAEKITREVL